MHFSNGAWVSQLIWILQFIDKFRAGKIRSVFSPSLRSRPVQTHVQSHRPSEKGNLKCQVSASSSHHFSLMPSSGQVGGWWRKCLRNSLKLFSFFWREMSLKETKWRRYFKRFPILDSFSFVESSSDKISSFVVLSFFGFFLLLAQLRLKLWRDKLLCCVCM